MTTLSRRGGLGLQIAAVGLCGVGIACFFAATYAIHRFAVPLGWDTAGYAWRTNLARTMGVANLPSHIPPPGPTNPGRPGFVTLASFLSTLTRTSPLRLSELLPGVAGAAMGLASGTLVSKALGRGVTWLLATAAAVGTSVFLVHTINLEGYQDATLALAILVAALLAVVLAASDRRAAVPATVLLVAAGLAHWNVLEIGGAVVAAMVLAYVPASVRLRAHGTAILRTPSVRLFGVGAIALGVTAAWITGLLTAPLPSPRTDTAQFFGKLRRDLPGYHLPFVIAVAAIGAILLAWEASRASSGEDHERFIRPFLACMLGWTEVAVVLYVAERAFGDAVPSHRILAMTLPLPILGAIALLTASAVARGRWRAVAAAATVVAIAASAFVAQGEWLSYRPVMHEQTLREASAANAYLAARQVPPSHPVVFLTDDRTPDAWSHVWLAAHEIRAMLSPQRIRSAYLYVGTERDFLAGKPTLLPPSSRAAQGISASDFNALSVNYFEALATAGHPVAFALASMQGNGAQRARGRAIAPGVTLVVGPAPDRTARLPASSTPAPGGLFVLGMSALLLLLIGVAGLGWARALFLRWLDPVQVAAIAPSVGIAVLIGGGTLWSRLGGPLRGPGAVAGYAIVAAGGLAASLVRRRAGRRETAEPAPILVTSAR